VITITGPIALRFGSLQEFQAYVVGGGKIYVEIFNPVLHKDPALLVLGRAE